MSWRGGLLAATVCAVAGLGLSSCGDSGDGGDEDAMSHAQLAAQLNKARAFKDFELYWVGPSFQGNNLNKGTFFIYGDCELSGGDEPSCAEPYQLQESKICGRPRPNKLALEPDFRYIKVPPHAVAWFDFGGLNVRLGDTHIKIYAPSKKLAIELAQQLRSVNDNGLTRPLPAPRDGPTVDLNGHRVRSFAREMGRC